MDFDFSDDQKFLKSETRRFLAAHCSMRQVRAVLDDAGLFHDPALWRDVTAQGWTGVTIPEAYGGLGLSQLELCVIAEELGRALAPIPFASTVYGLAAALMIAGSEQQKQRLLPKIAGGALIGALAVAEHPGATDPDRIETECRDGRITGEKLPVTDGEIADMALVLAREDGELDLFLVDLHGEGVARSTLSTLDPTRGAAKLSFRAAAAERLGEHGAGRRLLEQIRDRMAVPLAFEQVGLADHCLEMARDYALERYAFGRVIGSYQAIKQKLADMYVKNEIARSSAYYGAWALNDGAVELPLAASAARVAGSEAAWYATKENIQTHGGIGFTWEADCHLFHRRARQLSLVIGAPRVWKARLVDQLELRQAAAAA